MVSRYVAVGFENRLGELNVSELRISTGAEPCGCVEKAGGVDLSRNVTEGELCRGGLLA